MPTLNYINTDVVLINENLCIKQLASPILTLAGIYLLELLK